MSISKIKRSSLKAVAALSVLAATSMAATTAMAAGFPEKPIKWVVGYPAGGGSDFIARTLAASMSEILGQPIVVDNRPGASGMIAAQHAISSGADGYTIMNADNGMLVYNSALYPNLSYKPMTDFESIGLIVRFPIIIVGGPSNTFKTATELMGALKDKPGAVNYATGGLASPQSIAMEMLKDKSKLEAMPVHYRGGAPAVTDLLGGHIPLMALDLATATPLLKADKVKPIASFSKGGLASMPEVQSLVDLGYTDVEAFAWQGLVVPAGTPPEAKKVLADALNKSLNNEAVRAKLLEFGVEITPSTPEEMNAFWKAESDYWIDMLRRRNISAE